jgi:AAA domain, putative AbiEii toxin, Type IV TA system/AAA domain
MVRLQKVALQGFQSYVEEQVIDIDDHVTLLAGRNNVGKSAFLRALQIPVTRQEGATERFRMTYTWLIDTVDLSTVGSVEVRDWLIARGGSPKVVEVTFDATARQEGALSLDDIRASQVQIPGHARAADGAWQGMEPTNVLEGALNELIILATSAAQQVLYLAPRRVELGPRQLYHSAELQPDARNLTDVLVYLILNHPYDTFAEVQALMQTAFPGVRGLGVPTPAQVGGGSQLQGEPQVYFDGRQDPVPLRLCGTGLEQMLALAIGVLTASEPRLVLIDEPQAYLHPHAERSMLKLLDAHPEHQFIVSTHSHTLLRSQRLSQTRLLSLEHGRTRVAQVQDEGQALEALGVSAADLWLVDRLLWVEGPTEQAVFEMLVASIMSEAECSTLRIRRMPEASRFAAKSHKQAEAAYRFCTQVASAIAPVAVQMLFVFDRDEKPPEFQERMKNISAHQAVFLPVRELENLFLDADLVHAGLADLCEQYGIATPESVAVADKLNEIVGRYDSRELYPAGPPSEGESLSLIKGSRALAEVWWDLTEAEYDKVRDGERLARASLASGAHKLKPLVEIVNNLRAQEANGAE